MWRIGLVLHAAAYILWMLLAIVAVMFLLDGCATFIAGGIEAVT